MVSSLYGGYSGYPYYGGYGGYNSPVAAASLDASSLYGGNRNRDAFENSFRGNPYYSAGADLYGGGISGMMQQLLQTMLSMLMSRQPDVMLPPYGTGSTTRVETEKPKPMVTDPYAGGKDGRIFGDPHFVGFDGEQYDVQGEAGKTYNLLSDKNYQMNGEFKKWGDGGATVIGKLGFQVGSSKVALDADGTAGPKVTTIENGVAKETVLQDGQTVNLDQGGSATWKDGKLTVVSNEYTTTAIVNKVEGAGNYIDVDTKINANGPHADGVSAHGLLGQTADNLAGGKDTGVDQGVQGGRAIDGAVADYAEADLFGNDSKYSRYDSRVAYDSRGMDDTTDITYDWNGNVLYKKAVDAAHTTAATTLVKDNASQEDKTYLTRADFVKAATKEGAWAAGRDIDAHTYYSYADRNRDGRLTADEAAIAQAESDANGDKSVSGQESLDFVQKIRDWRYNQ